MRKDKLSLFVFIDAFGWALLQRHAFLDDELTTKASLGTVLGYSSTCIPTILTGKLPREHGHFSFFYYNPDACAFGAYRHLDLLPVALTRRDRFRRLVSKSMQKHLGYTGYFQIYNVPFKYLPCFDYAEKRDIYAPGGINGGVATIFDHLHREDIVFHCSDWRINEKENLDSLGHDLELGEIDTAYLYLPALDGTLHMHGTHSSKVADKIAWYECKIRDILARARRNYDTVNLYVFSDHGMTDVSESCALLKRIDDTGLVFGTDYVAMYDSTMARFWFLNDVARDVIEGALHKEPRGRVLSNAELRAYGCDFPDHQYGELFFLMNPGVLICPSFMGHKAIAGMHGYEPEHVDSVAMFATNTTMDVLPRRLDDLHDVMVREVSSQAGSCAVRPRMSRRLIKDLKSASANVSS